MQAVLPFDTLEEVVVRSNAAHDGLVAGVFTLDIDKAHLLAQTASRHYLVSEQVWLPDTDDDVFGHRR